MTEERAAAPEAEEEPRRGIDGHYHTMHPQAVRMPADLLAWYTAYAEEHDGVTRNGLMVEALEAHRARLVRAGRMEERAAHAARRMGGDGSE